MRQLYRIIIFFIIILLLIACQNQGTEPEEISVSATVPTPLPPTPTPTPLPTETPTATPTYTPSPIPPTPYTYGPENVIAGVNPLTGLSLEHPDDLNRRPLLIKISNAPPVVRPQSGIGSADIIIEEYVEGGWTRFAALFYGEEVDHIGSVRSVRLVDFQLAQAFDALLVFSGGSQGVIELLRQEPLYPYNTISPQFGFGQPYFVRFPREGLDFEHTLFTSTTILRQWAEDRNVRETPYFLEEPGNTFTNLPPDNGIPASHATISYAKTQAEWQYDPMSGRYLRWTDAIPHTDALSGEQLAFSNVIVISAYHEEVDILPEKFFGQEKSLFIQLYGSGPATLLRDGRAYEGSWQRENGKHMLLFIDSEGNPLPLKPGKSFIHIIRAGFEILTIVP